jgi:hypothetical protein
MVYPFGRSSNIGARSATSLVCLMAQFCRHHLDVLEPQLLVLVHLSNVARGLFHRVRHHSSPQRFGTRGSGGSATRSRVALGRGRTGEPSPLRKATRFVDAEPGASRGRMTVGGFGLGDRWGVRRRGRDAFPPLHQNAVAIAYRSSPY